MSLFDEDVRNCRNDKLVTDAISRNDEPDAEPVPEAIENLELALRRFNRNDYAGTKQAIQWALAELKRL